MTYATPVTHLFARFTNGQLEHGCDGEYATPHRHVRELKASPTRIKPFNPQPSAATSGDARDTPRSRTPGVLLAGWEWLHRMLSTRNTEQALSRSAALDDAARCAPAAARPVRRTTPADWRSESAVDRH